jgi:hypothetical protein
MIVFSTKTRVDCSDGLAGFITYVIVNPENHAITHLVVKNIRPPSREKLAPVEQVDVFSPERIRLKCSLHELDKLEPFETESYVRTDELEMIPQPYDLLPAGTTAATDATYSLMTFRNIPQGEIAVQLEARVEATDGYAGQVDEFLVDSQNLQVTHLVLSDRHIFQRWKIVIPVSQIGHVDEDTIFLKLDKQGIEELPITPI